MIKILKIEFEKISKIKKFPSNLKFRERMFETSKFGKQTEIEIHEFIILYLFSLSPHKT